MSKQHADELRRRAEQQLATRDRQIEGLERADLASLAHELAVHQIELEIQNEELLRTRTLAEEARDRYLDLYDFAPVGYFTLDEHVRIVEANLTGCRLLRADRQNLLNTRFTKFLPKEEAERFYFHRKKTLEGVTQQTCELKMRQADDALFDARLESIRAGEGRLRVAVIDVTERKQAEEAMRESEEKYRRIVETATEGIVMVDAHAQVVFANDRWSEIFGYSLEEARHMTHFDMVFPEDRAQMTERWESRKRGVKERYEFRFRRKDGSPLWALIGAAPRFDAAERFLGTLVMVTDITQRKRAEEQLRELAGTLESKVAERTAQLQQRARQLQKLTLELTLSEDRERKRIAQILHDDLQQVLVAAKFHVGLLKDRVAQKPEQQAVAVKVDEMLKDAIAKSRSLSHELSPAVLHRNDLAETLAWLGSQMRAKHGLTVRVDAPEKMRLQSEPITLFLLRAAQELLFNVIKHAGVNEARIRVRRRGRCIFMSVSDRGRGFDARQQKETGGFGLFNIRERTELLGGRMKIRSAIGKGSTFHLVVPDGQEPEDRRQRTEDSGALRGPSSVLSPPSSGCRLRVLLADDHTVARQGIASLLTEEHDIEMVAEATTGREAVELADRLHPDVVIMDVSLPLLSGDEATRQIKRHLPQTRIVAVSVYDEAEIVNRMHEAGAESYVLKTAPSEELLAAIRGENQVRRGTPV